MNPSNVPHTLTANEAKRVEKLIAKDSAAAEKHVARVGKALKSAEKQESKTEKVCLLTTCGGRHAFTKIY